MHLRQDINKIYVTIDRNLLDMPVPFVNLQGFIINKKFIMKEEGTVLKQEAILTLIFLRIPCHRNF